MWPEFGYENTTYILYTLNHFSFQKKKNQKSIFAEIVQPHTRLNDSSCNKAAALPPEPNIDNEQRYFYMCIAVWCQVWIILVKQTCSFDRAVRKKAEERIKCNRCCHTHTCYSQTSPFPHMTPVLFLHQCSTVCEIEILYILYSRSAIELCT